MVVALEDGAFAGSWYIDSVADVIDDPAVVIAIDTPLGETTPGDRRADNAARDFLKPRIGLVFPAPLFAALECESREDGSALSIERCGKGIGSTTWGLRKYMRDARPFWCADPERIREVHPECSFRAMAESPLQSKKGWLGLRQRVTVLGAHGIDMLADTHSLDAKVASDDVLDAAAAAWTANRIGLGDAVSLPDPPERDDAGRAVAIWF